MSDGKKNECLRQSDTCKACFEENCNQKKETQKCYVTDGNPLNSMPSHLDFKNTTSKTCKQYNDVCFTLITDGVVVRDCLNEYAERNHLPINFLYENYISSMYNVCSSSLCNNHKVSPTYCISCDSREDQNCNGQRKAFEREECPLEVIPSGCYHHIHGEYIQRGCIARLSAKKLELCESNSDLCKKCNGNVCNHRTSFQKCLHSNENSIDSTESKICKRYLDHCYVHVSNDTVWRGCMSDFTGNSLDYVLKSRLTLCSGRDNCNNHQVEPEYCIVCRGKHDCAHSPNTSMREKCPLSVNELGCYLHESEHYVERGCVSKLDVRERSYCQMGDNHCKVCSGDSCNKKVSFQICHVCDSKTSKNDECLRTPWKTEEMLCPNYTDECYTYVKDDIIKRGCIGDMTIPNIEDCDQNSNECKRCSDKRSCNDIAIKTDICISCDSKTDPTCATNTTFEIIEECPHSTHSHSCYHFIDDKAQHHRRGKITISPT